MVLSMKTKIYISMIVSIFLICSLASADLLEREQTSGGEAYPFYYADQSNTNDRHRFAMQTFKVDMIREITKISLKLKVIDTMNVCWGSSERFDLQIRNSKDSVIASKNDLSLCGLPQTYFGWQEISFSAPIAVMPGENYKIAVLYRGDALKNTAAMYWERSTSDVYAEGRSTDGNFIESSKDFTFRVYGNKAVLCDSGWYCKDVNTLDYKNSDCSWANTPQACGSDSYCDMNANSCEKKVDVGIKEIETYDSSGIASSFDPEEQITYQISALNNGGVGKFNAYFKIFDASQKLVDSASFLDQTADSKGLTGSLKTLNSIRKIGAGWQGSYTFEAKVEPCLGTESCTSTKSFSVKASCPDNGQDEVTICQNDCNDNDPSINPYAEEICGNNIDDNCNLQVDEGCDPLLTFTYAGTHDQSGQAKTEFAPEEMMMLGVCVKNEGAAGEYDINREIIKGSQQAYTNISTEQINPGITKCSYNIFNIPTGWSGDYTYKAKLGAETKTASFTVKTVCKDEDGDGYYTNCDPLDCDDNDKLVHTKISCASDGNSCGEYSLCLASCPAVPEEILCDGIDNDCDTNTKDDACGSGMVCDFGKRVCVSVCTEGWKCKDHQTLGYLNNLCSWSSLTTAGNNAFCDLNENKLACEGGYDSCDEDWSNGCEVDLNSDSDNCGSCGNVCDKGGICSNSLCIPEEDYSFMTNETIVYMHPDLMNSIAIVLVQTGKVNKVFFQNETEEDAERMLLDILAGYQQKKLEAVALGEDAVSFFVSTEDQWMYLVQNQILDDALGGRFEIPYVGKNTDELVIFYQADALNDVERAYQQIDDLEKGVKELKTLGNILSVGLSLHYGITQSDGDFGKFIVYSGTHFAYNFHPIMAGMNLVKFTKDSTGTVVNSALAVVGVDPINVTCQLNETNYLDPSVAGGCGVWLVDGVISVMTDEKIMIENNLEGECGLMSGNFPVCIARFGEGLQLFTHPFPMIEDITAIQAEDKITFKESLKDYQIINTLSKEIWVGASVISEDCVHDLPPQLVKFDMGEEKEVNFVWDLPRGIQKNKKLVLVSKIWYGCTDCSVDYCTLCQIGNGDPSYIDFCTKCVSCNKESPYKLCGSEQKNYVCYGDNLEQMNIALSGMRINFTIENKVSIINSVRCDSNNYMGVECPKDITVQAGDSLLMTLTAHDIDDDKLTVNFAGNYPGGRISKSCTDMDKGQRCEFIYQATAEDIGKDYWINLAVSDGYNQTIRNFNFNVQSPPTLLSGGGINHKTAAETNIGPTYTVPTRSASSFEHKVTLPAAAASPPSAKPEPAAKEKIAIEEETASSPEEPPKNTVLEVVGKAFMKSRETIQKVISYLQSYMGI